MTRTTLTTGALTAPGSRLRPLEGMLAGHRGGEATRYREPRRFEAGVRFEFWGRR